MKDIKGAIFDLDGTLLDSMHVWRTIGSRYLTLHGAVPKPDLIEKIKPMTLSEAAEYFRTEYGLTQTVREIIDGVNDLIGDSYRLHIKEKESVRRFLEKLKAGGVKMCVATATDRPLVEAALSRLGLDKYFCGLITCAEAGRGKEYPDIYRKALCIVGCKKEEAAVFEDALYAVKTAAKDGFYVVGIADSFSSGDQEEIKKYASRFIEDWSELL